MIKLDETREAGDKARLKALRDAARLGVADIEAGRYRDFDSPASLNQLLNSVTKVARSSLRQVALEVGAPCAYGQFASPQ